MSEEKANNANVLARTVFLSLAIHLLILLAGPWVDVNRRSKEFQPKGIRAVLQMQPDAVVNKHSLVHASRNMWHARRYDHKPAVAVSAANNRAEKSENSGAANSTDNLESPVLADGLRRYHLNLAREARRYLVNPRGIVGVGVVIVEIHLGELPVVPLVGLFSSSGNPLLDADALALVASAVHTVDIPRDLRGRTLVLHFPVEYSNGD